jgi:P-type E1-E2 ATPase
VGAVLVVATPCPLLLATPVAIISGINRAARRGIIVKGGSATERIARATAVIFDKTGTLTAGTPVVARVVALNGRSADEVLRLAAGLEQLSGHHLARALVRAGHERVGALPLPHGVTEAAGLGVSGHVDGHAVDIGSLAYAAHKSLATSEALDQARAAAGADGATTTTAVVGVDGRMEGLVIYADPMRAAVPALLRRLKALGVREMAMVTGETPRQHGPSPPRPRSPWSRPTSSRRRRSTPCARR